MAHLVYCRCGRQYRCELLHKKNPDVICEDGTVIKHQPCPDAALHGEQRQEIKFSQVVSSPIQI